jgi:hypothetical protein
MTMLKLKKEKSPLKGVTGILKCTIRELPAHLDHFQAASKVQRAENEDSEKVNRFKYACGRNADLITSLIKTINIDLTKITAPVDGFDDYMTARSVICEKHCQRDETGNPKFIGGEEDKENGGMKRYIFNPETLKIAKKEIAALDKTYKTVLAKVEKQQTDMEEYLDKETKVSLYCVEWKDLPERISGTYLVVLSPMIKNIPEV